MQAHNALHNFTYNAALAKQYDVAEDDHVGLFVNCNRATVRYNSALDLDVARRAFEHKLRGMYNYKNTAAHPVDIYMQDNEYIAWYDWENACGYIATKQAATA